MICRVSKGGFDRYVETWSLINGAGSSTPLVLVSAEGGGVRASAWTAMVLAHLEDETDGGFSRYMLAGSGVSGGSVGLTMFAGLVKARKSNKLGNDLLSNYAKSIHRTDFLKPPVINLLFADLPHRFLPGSLWPDRGQQLEHAFERAWWTIVGNTDNQGLCVSNPLCDSFASLYNNQEQSVPLLFLNATVVQTGERFIQHPFSRFTADDEEFRTIFPASVDATKCLSASTPLSTVAHNSARFPYISPAGTISECNVLDQHDNESHSIQVVDGGYFENSATETLGDIYYYLRNNMGDFSPCCIWVVHISNGSDVGGLNSKGTDVCSSEIGSKSRLRGELTAPLATFFSTREGRGRHARERLSTNLHDRFFHFRLCASSQRLPLGWALSNESITEMQRQLNSEAATERHIKAHREYINVFKSAFDK